MAVTLTGKLSALATGGAVSKTSDGAYVITDTVYIGSGGSGALTPEEHNTLMNLSDDTTDKIFNKVIQC